ncbi:metallophosphatase family protein [Brucepastera parasyntrophica]|uniref:metallophosphoesterase family protein n=1 Tax=Brucepastera parasyntrophica TaxID=2880008 RepID=UPI00210BFEF8|nr:metallophosphoesterase family protein [Brucepastera parasyntrophica]ULQ58486.1 metallophosphatase family protein [Brucepastera parasyntrophica]
MKFILASDIHANLPALEAFFHYLEKENLSSLPVYFLGDYVNLGPYPEETVELLRKFDGKIYLCGNHDRYMNSEYALEHNPYFSSTDGVRHSHWTRTQLSPESLKWLEALPARHQFDAGGWHIDMVHGRHNSDEETLRAADLETDKNIIYICGHTHFTRNETAGKARILNPGSLGKPLDSDSRASFGIVTIEENSPENPGPVTFDIIRIPYDIDRTVAALEQRNVPWRNGMMTSLRTAVYTDD